MISKLLAVSRNATFGVGSRLPDLRISPTVQGGEHDRPLESLPGDLLAELLLGPVQVPLFHDEDQIHPAEMPGRDADPGPRFGADRPNVMPTFTV